MTHGNQKRGARKLALQLGIALLALGATIGVAACGGSASGADSVDLVAYSTPQQVYEDKLQPAFQNAEAGDGVDFSNSFGSSGDQSRAVEAGQPADVVAFSLEPDMTRLVDAGLVAPDWNRNEYQGIVTDSVVTLMVRPGNPKNIRSFDDLVRDDVEVINPNPATSGGARWNIMAIYGSQIEQGKSEAEAQDFVKRVIENTSVQDDSARDSLNTFGSGKGDVLVGYENEAIQAQQEGIEVEYVTPDSTILIENPIAVTKDASSAAQPFVDFLYSDEGQQAFADAGYRPVNEAVFDQNADQFPIPPGLFTIADFGGWSKVSDPFFGDDGWVIQAEADLGNPTE
jgi:sulfate/thiosulfate-binding protein